MKLRIRWPEGSSTVTLSGEELTLNSLRSSIEEASSIPAQLQQISCGFPPVKLETETDGSTLLANIGIGKGDQITVERSVAKRQRSSVDCPFSAGQIVLYLPTQEPVTIIKAHLDDPAELYITVQMPDGREKQTVLSKLTPVAEAASEKVAVWRVRYDQIDELDYTGDELLAEIAFIGDHSLFDVTSDTVLPWRYEGQQWLPDQPDQTTVEGAGVEEAESNDVVIPLSGGVTLPDAVEQIVQTGALCI